MLLQGLEPEELQALEAAMQNFRISSQEDALACGTDGCGGTSAAPFATPSQRVARRQVATTGKRTGTTRRAPVRREYDSTDSDEVGTLPSLGRLGCRRQAVLDLF